jgi:hypothetical protein
VTSARPHSGWLAPRPRPGEAEAESRRFRGATKQDRGSSRKNRPPCDTTPARYPGSMFAWCALLLATAAPSHAAPQSRSHGILTPRSVSKCDETPTGLRTHGSPSPILIAANWFGSVRQLPGSSLPLRQIRTGASLPPRLPARHLREPRSRKFRRTPIGSDASRAEMSAGRCVRRSERAPGTHCHYPAPPD